MERKYSEKNARYLDFVDEQKSVQSSAVRSRKSSGSRQSRCSRRTQADRTPTDAARINPRDAGLQCNEQPTSRSQIAGDHDGVNQTQGPDVGSIAGVPGKVEGWMRRNNNGMTPIGTDMWRQLNRVSIPTFDGDKRAYDGWKAAFMSCVDAAPATAEYKLLQLRSYLKGEALQVVERLGHSAMAYEAAKERLERKYGGFRRKIAICMEELDSLKPIRHGMASDVEKLADLMDVLVINMTEAGRLDELGDGSLYIKSQKKLSESMLAAYKRWLYEKCKPESMESLKEWLLLESEFQTIAAETIHGVGARKKTTKDGSSFFGNNAAEQQKKKCAICANDHVVSNCPEFIKMDSRARWIISKKKRLCYHCLSKNHFGKDCRKMTKICETNGCQDSHHPLLHFDRAMETKKSATSNQGSSNDGSKASPTFNAVSDKAGVVSLRTIPVIVRHGNKKLSLIAMLDEGSMETYIDEAAASQLNLKGEERDMSVSGHGGMRRSFKSREVKFQLESLEGRFSKEIRAQTSTNLTGHLKAVDWRAECRSFPHLRKIQFPCLGKRRTPDLMIGSDYPGLHIALEEIKGEEDEPVARLTPLGWTCIGRLPKHRSSGEAVMMTSFFTGGIAQLNSTLERFWAVEELDMPSTTMSVEDKHVFNRCKESIGRRNGRYEVELPWKEAGKSSLGDNFFTAMKRLKSNEKSIMKRGTTEKYQQIIQGYIDKQYVTKVEDGSQERGWYLPHFAVVTHKTRMVMDASSSHDGVSLNDAMHKGPKLQQSLFNVLLRFRKNPVALVGDVAEMYLQIHIPPQDQKFHRFLWRDMQENRKPDVYEFNRVVFGVNCSPFLAQLVTQEHAKQFQCHYPMASEAVLKSTYMDDTMDSKEDDDEAIMLYQQLKGLWNAAGMHARKWLSNSPAVLEKIPEDDRAAEVDLEAESLPSVKTLGVTWKAHEDAFTFSSKQKCGAQKVTKRSFLSSIATVFDPLGLLSPFIVQAKMVLQDIWLVGSDWDEQLPEEITAKIMNWYEDLQSIQKILVPRCLRRSSKPTDVTLHFFCDASILAYAAVAYQRTVHADGLVTVRMIAAKSKVAPIKAVSIPRLELMGAVLSVRLAAAISTTLEVDANRIYYWTDSMNVVCWIRQRSRTLKTFVANRVAKIQEASKVQQWRHVGTKLNPADIASRGTSAIELSTSELWWNGPGFLLESIDRWPALTTTDDDSKEAKKEVKDSAVQWSSFHCLEISDECRLEPARFSTLIRLQRVLAWTIRFWNNCRNPSQRLQGELTVDELADSENRLIKTAQATGFPEEHKQLIDGKQIGSKSKLLSLQPFVDEDGIIRANSRIKHAEMPFEMRCPIILPRRNWVTKLFVRRVHSSNGHAIGTNHTLALLSQRFWILQGREEIRECENECNTCVRRKAKQCSQVMAPLPRSRLVNRGGAFSTTAVDCAGPFETIQGRGKARSKRYLCLFTCTTTRAVHLEMVFSLSTDSFLNAFFRMVSRRGQPAEMISDNGTNFVGGESELKKLFEDQRKIVKSLANRGIKWSFNPPLAPHFGGVHESMIKSAKRAIGAIMGKSDVNDEELVSAFSGAESLLNSRPITYQSANPNDLVPLTPNHFLHGRAGGEFVSQAIDETPYSYRQRWRRVQELVRHFWQRWMRELLPTLGRRNKWNIAKRDVAVNDIVLVIDPDTPRARWPIAKVTAVYPGTDGHVRAVDVLMSGKIYRRPITRLCYLELSEL